MRADPVPLDSDMSKDELEVFMRKLEEFTRSLTSKERALLLQVLTRAERETPEDVEAHYSNLLLSLGAAAVSLHDASFDPAR